MSNDWVCRTHPTGRRYWVLVGTEYLIETTGWNMISAKSGADRGKRVGGGYRAYRGRQSLGGFHSTLQSAQARVERDMTARETAVR